MMIFIFVVALDLGIALEDGYRSKNHVFFVGKKAQFSNYEKLFGKFSLFTWLFSRRIISVYVESVNGNLEKSTDFCYLQTPAYQQQQNVEMIP